MKLFERFKKKEVVRGSFEWLQQLYSNYYGRPLSEEEVLFCLDRDAKYFVRGPGHVMLASTEIFDEISFQSMSYVHFFSKMDGIAKEKREQFERRQHQYVFDVMSDLSLILREEGGTEEGDAKYEAKIENYAQDKEIDLTWELFEASLLDKVPEELVNFIEIESFFKKADHKTVKEDILSKDFMNFINEEFVGDIELLELYKYSYEENGIGNPMGDNRFFQGLVDAYFFLINARIIEVYEESAKGKSGRTQKAERKHVVPQDFSDSVINLLTGNIETGKKQKKMESYIRRILDAAHRNQIPLPMEQLKAKVQEQINTVIDISQDDIERLKQESVNFGFPLQRETREKVQRVVSENQEVASEEDELDEETLEGYIPEGGWRSLEFTDITPNGVIDFFTEQGFNFENEKKFQKEFKKLLIKTQYGKQKKEKLMELLNKPPREIWQSYGGKGEYGPYFVLKLNAGNGALRIVRSGNMIEHFLDHDEYDRIYGKGQFSK